MKNRFYFFIVIIFCSLSVKAQTCDSIRLVLHSTRVDASITRDYLVIDSIRDNQVISTTENWWDPVQMIFQPGQTYFFQWDTTGNQITQTSGNYQYIFEYDTAGRLISREYATYNGSSWDTASRFEKYYTIFNRDSMELLYYFTSGIPDLVQRIRWQYDSLERIIRKTTDEYLNSVFLVTEDIITDYSSAYPGIVRVDTVYTNYGNGLQLIQANGFTLDNQGAYNYTIYASPPNIMFPFGSLTAQIVCGDTLWEWGAGHSGRWRRGTYNADCLPVWIENGSGSLSSGTSGEVSNYSYVNCNLMQVYTASNKTKICSGDTLSLAANVFGGTPPYHYQWSSNRGNFNDTISHPFFFPDSSCLIYLRVLDSNLDEWLDTLSILVNKKYLADLSVYSIDSVSSCNSAEIVANGAAGGYMSWAFEHQGIYPNTSSDTIITANYTGWYFVNIYSGVCPVAQDSIEITGLPHPHPFLTVTSACNQMIAYSSANGSTLWYNFTDSIPFFSGDTLNIIANGNYQAVFTDTAGCKSNRYGYYFEVFKLTPAFQNACNDSCLGTAGVSVLPHYQNYQYLWSNGDTLSFTDSLCNAPLSVTVTNRTTCCQLTARDSCLGVSVPEIERAENRVLTVFPNPTEGILHFRLEKGSLIYPVQWQARDVYGRLTDEQIIFENHVTLDRKKYKYGLYFFTVTDKSGFNAAGKFLFGN